MAFDQNQNARDHFTKEAIDPASQRMLGYDINDLERTEIREHFSDCRDLEKEEQQDFADSFETRLDNEIDRLQTEQGSGQGRAYTPQGQSIGFNQGQLIRQADINVTAQHHQKLESFRKDRDQKVDAVLQNARDEGRGPDQNRDQSQDREQYQSRGSFANELDQQQDHDR